MRKNEEKGKEKRKNLKELRLVKDFAVQFLVIGSTHRWDVHSSFLDIPANIHMCTILPLDNTLHLYMVKLPHICLSQFLKIKFEIGISDKYILKMRNLGSLYFQTEECGSSIHMHEDS